jgi:hypothetical protein
MKVKTLHSIGHHFDDVVSLGIQGGSYAVEAEGGKFYQAAQQ